VLPSCQGRASGHDGCAGGGGQREKIAAACVIFDGSLSHLVPPVAWVRAGAEGEHFPSARYPIGQLAQHVPVSCTCQPTCAGRPMLLETDVMADELKDLRIPVMMAPTDVAAIDEWRRKQDDLPSRSEAIRRLVELGLKAKR